MFNIDYQKILEDLEKNVKDKKDLEYVKGQFSKLVMIFLKEINSMQSIYEKRIYSLESKMNNIEEQLSRIENDIYTEDDLASVEELTCPYCDANFLAEIDETKTEIKCPECENLIELDWGENDSDEEDDM